MPQLTSGRRNLVLLTVCLAVFAINLNVTVVNVALPDLSRQLHAGTQTLQWVVDGYNLAFAALVLAGGSIGDRLGRRPVLLAGLLGFAVSSGLAATAPTAAQLVAWRFVMGAFAALIYPTTLSIIANAYPDRGERTRAIGVWGAVTGIGVAVGPVTGGLLLAHYSWPSVFVALVPVAVVASTLTVAFVPESREAGAAGMDLPGLALSSAAIGLLVYTFIEAPSSGWGSARTLGGFAGTAVLGALFAVVERRRANPMIDVSLFRVPAFSAASASVTISFFALYGFIFLVTQYMQFLRGWGTLSAGVRTLPVAFAIAAGSAAGAVLSGRVGTRRVVVAGLALFGVAFAVIAASPEDQPYLQIAGEMILMGVGLGLTSTPATESIMSVLPAAKAGVGSAVNDATREAGGTLGVAVIGSVFSSVYLHHLGRTAVGHLPAHLLGTARSSVGAAVAVAHAAPAGVRPALTSGVQASFMSGFHVACVVAAAVCAAGALVALHLPGRPVTATVDSGAPSTAGVAAAVA